MVIMMGKPKGKGEEQAASVATGIKPNPSASKRSNTSTGERIASVSDERNEQATSVVTGPKPGIRDEARVRQEVQSMSK